jgi:hypothetical protein
MTDSAETVRKKSGEVFRELAAHQGAAYRSYGDALVRFGEGSLNTSDLLKEAGDLYYREAGRVASSLFSGFAELFAGGLDLAGAKILPKGGPEARAAPADQDPKSKKN